MPKVNLIGLDGYSFQIDTDERIKFGMFEDSDLTYLKYEVSCHLSNVIKQQIYDELNIDTHSEIDDVFDVFITSTLIRKWLDVDAKRIQLILGNTILKDELFKTRYLEDGYTINYIILPTVNVNKDTPTTFKELTKEQIEKARKEQKNKGRVSKFDK